MLIVALLVLVFLFFFIFTKKDDVYKIKIQEFDFSNLCASQSERAPRIIPTREYDGTMHDVMRNKNKNVFLHCKQVFDSYLWTKYGKRVENIINKYNIPRSENEDVVFRMASTPHKILTHFDCVPRYTMMLRGDKEFLLFKMDGIDDEVQFLKDVQHENMQGIIGVLEKNKIQYNKFTLHEGECFYLEPGMYHYIENNAKNDYTILVNIDYPNLQDGALQQKWLSMWQNGVWIDAS